MTAVVDLGCYTHPGYPEDESTEKLIRRFRPDRYIGFDPHPDMAEDHIVRGGLVEFITTRQAAWFEDGTVAYDIRRDRPLAAAVGSGPLTVPCFDLAVHLRRVATSPLGFPLIVKFDVEGAEYPLLHHLHAERVDALVTVALVEWHEKPGWRRDRDDLLARLRCPVEEW